MRLLSLEFLIKDANCVLLFLYLEGRVVSVLVY